MIPLRLGRRGAEDGQLGRMATPVPAAHTPGPYDGVVEDEPPVRQLMVGADGSLRPDRPAPAPPFRLLPPMQAQARRPAEEEGMPSLRMPLYASAPAPSGEWSEQSRLRQELRARPLTQSTYGMAIVQLLTMPWVRAPSGLATVVFAPGTPAAEVQAIATHINDLACGASAYADGPAGVLGVARLEQLNKMLARCGLSPIVASDTPQPWHVLGARRPPDFVLEDFDQRGPRPPSHLLAQEDDA